MLYKFHRINNFLNNLLLDSSLWFSNPTEFNDPFDMQFSSNLKMENNFKEKIVEDELLKIDFISLGIKESEIRDSVTKDFEEFDPVSLLNSIMSNTVQEMGVCCFSKVFDNILMWSHYTDGHKGVCIEFDPEGLKKIEKSLLFEMRYSNDFPYVFNSEDLKQAFITKSTCWQYEEEYRIIRPRRGSITFPQEAITSIIFGAKTDASEIKRLIQLIKKLGYGGVVFKKAEIDSTKYKLLFKIIN